MNGILMCGNEWWWWGGTTFEEACCSRQGGSPDQSIDIFQESDITAKAGHLGGLRKKDKKNS